MITLFVGHNVQLRPLQEVDQTQLHKIKNQYPAKKFLGAALPESQQEVKQWINKMIKLQEQQKVYIFGIIVRKSHHLIGITGLKDISVLHRSASCSIAIYDSQNWNKGYGTESLQLLLSIGFELLNLHSINLRVYTIQNMGIQAYQNVGFKITGRLREKDFVEGGYVDDAIMDILEHEYYNIVQKNTAWPRISSYNNHG